MADSETDSTIANLKTLRFEPLNEGHIEQILTIERMTNGAPWSERSFRNELDHEQGFFTVAKMDGKVVGYGGVWFVIDEAHITTVAVAEVHRNLGIGRKMMYQLLNKAKEMGMECSTLEVRAGNAPAIHLYETLGYKTTALRKGYYPDNKEDAAVMWMYNLQSWEPVSR